MRIWILAGAALALAACGEAQQAPEAQAPATSAAAPAAPIGPAISTASDARTIIELAGFAEVTDISTDASGHWVAAAKLRGEPVHVRIDDTGVPVVFEPAAPPT